MECGAVGESPSRGPTLASSWAAARGSLARSLRVRRAAGGARDVGCEELLEAPGPGRELVVLQGGAPGPEQPGCFLALRCAPDAAEELVAVGVLSSARNMEVYLGHDYCGTGRGRAVGAAPGLSEHEKITLYQKHLKLESSTRACKIKLLSFGDKQCVYISTVGVHLRPAVPNASPSCRALGTRIDLERVQTLMAAVGSRLSPGARQLMDMVKLQQQNHLPVGEQLRALLGDTAKHQCITDLQPPEKPPCTPFPFRTGLAPVHSSGTKETAAPGPEGPHPEVPQHSTLPDPDPSREKASVCTPGPSSSLLPLLQDLCGQVSHLRASSTAPCKELPVAPAPASTTGLTVEQQPVCAYLEQMLSQKLELLGRQLRAHVDERIWQLQEHVDRQLAALQDSLRVPHSPPAACPLPHWDSAEKLSNGER